MAVKQGRPLMAATIKDRQIHVHVSAEELGQIKAQCPPGVPLSEYIRRRLLDK